MNTSFAFHKVVQRHISGEVDKFTTFWCNVSSGLRIPKIIEIGSRLTVILKIWDTVYKRMCGITQTNGMAPVINCFGVLYSAAIKDLSYF